MQRLTIFEHGRHQLLAHTFDAVVRGSCLLGMRRWLAQYPPGSPRRLVIALHADMEHGPVLRAHPPSHWTLTQHERHASPQEATYPAFGEAVRAFLAHAACDGTHWSEFEAHSWMRTPVPVLQRDSSAAVTWVSHTLSPASASAAVAKRYPTRSPQPAQALALAIHTLATLLQVAEEPTPPEVQQILTAARRVVAAAGLSMTNDA
ncbi:MAG: hypothetical protein EI684_19280 [Candidatus Viridilinea halotolerans]|uniref:Uncharacterized protein n=1 Tax=Candidatus Viridilinea halotolerans TaxID=2491704 RepID=A0A426TSS9_9CHLR|nr:MAG: hypothetical protein EI684_19280 [Candidatus Viridilinea halotolerans]